MSSDGKPGFIERAVYRAAHKHFAALEGQLHDQRQDLEQTRREIEECRRSKSIAEERLAAAHEDIELLKATAETEVIRRDQALEAVNATKIEMSKLHARIEIILAERERLMAQINEHEAQMNTLARINDELALTSNERDCLRNELESQRDRLAILEKQHEEEKYTNAQISAENSQACALEISNYKAEAHALETCLKKITDENQLLLAKLAAPNISSNIPPLKIIDERFKGRSQISPLATDLLAEARHLIIPVHRPKITHISNMFNRLQAAPSEFFDVKMRFIATTREERLEIENYIAIFKPLIPAKYEIVSATELLDQLGCPRAETLVRDNANGSNINIKKILGLYTSLISGAEEIITMDMDVIFLDNPEILFSKAYDNFKKRQFFAAHPTIDLMRDIVKTSAKYFSPYDQKILTAKMKNSDIYSWFYDAPYYPKKELSLFISHLHSLYMGFENALMALSWHSFDHILFMYFMMLHSDFEMIDVRKDIRQVEATDNLSVSDIFRIQEAHNYLPVWAPLPSIIKADAESLRNLDFVVAIHSDRLS